METTTRIGMCLALVGLFAMTTGCDEVIPFTVTVGPVDQAPGGPESQDGGGETGTQDDEGGPGPQDGPGEQDQGQSAAEQLQQALGDQRLTYLTSDGNGEVYTSQREDIDVCSSGQFQIRTVSQTSGYGTTSEDVYEAIGTWRIVTSQDGTQLLMELNRQQSTDGYTGTDYFLVESGASASELYFNGYRFNVAASPICN